MRERVWGNEYRQITVCVDSYQDGVPAGRLYHPYMKDGAPFQSLMQLLLLTEQLLNDMDFPQASTDSRTFLPTVPREFKPPPVSLPAKGTQATFRMRIIFRQHASWQGNLLWMEEKREENFRSVLELILLMESALTRGGMRCADPISESSSA